MRKRSDNRTYPSYRSEPWRMSVLKSISDVPLRSQHGLEHKYEKIVLREFADEYLFCASLLKYPTHWVLYE